jgi:hypothetical protein
MIELLKPTWMISKMKLLWDIINRISILWRNRMPKYYEFKVCGYYLYYTASCVVEAMHVHASDRKLTESGSAKFFVKNNGDTTVEKQGVLTDREVRKIRDFIKIHYKEMYLKWLEIADTGFYGEK